MLTLNMVLDMTLHLESFLTVRTKPGPTRIKLPVVDKVGLDQIVEGCKWKLESPAMLAKFIMIMWIEQHGRTNLTSIE